MAQVSSAFAGAAESYELMMGRWARRLAGPFLEFSGLTDDGKILDAGCGTGALTAELLQRTKAAEVTGVDISENYVTYARHLVQSPRARFEVGDLTGLSYPDGVFDQVFSQLVLLFVPDFEQGIRELKQAICGFSAVGNPSRAESSRISPFVSPASFKGARIENSSAAFAPGRTSP